MKKVTIIYDDRNIVSKELQDIVGKRTYGDIIYKKKSLRVRIKEICESNVYNLSLNMFVLKNDNDLSNIPSTTLYLYLKANYIIYNHDKFLNILSKLPYIDESYVLINDAYIFNNNVIDKFMNNSIGDLDIEQLQRFNNIDDIFIDISTLNNFLLFLSSGLDTRFFNQLSGNEYIITKSSSNISKIYNEYKYYQLIPDHMKTWFVMPYDYIETKHSASYKMERINATDIALKYIHNSITNNELTCILNKIFYFIKNRKEKNVSQNTYNEYKNNLYNIKVSERIATLKNAASYHSLATYIKQINVKYKDIDDIFRYYISLYNILSKYDNFNKLVIGHGDLCFSNILYNYSTNYMKFIDTKGASTEQELYTNPYYDLAKLSHSICGLYDFFNADLFTLNINNSLNIELTIQHNNNKEFIHIFRNILEYNGFNYAVTRLYEASLFLSMLPLHIDYPKKVLGFIVNAVNILEEVEKCLKN